MPRYRYPQTATAIRDDANGEPLASATVTIYLDGTLTLATAYADESTGTPLTSSVTTTDSTGNFKFWIDPKDYTNTQQFKVIVSKTGYSDKTYDNLQVMPDLSGVNDPYRDVRVYGASTSASATVNAAAFQAAVDAGGEVRIPDGTYNSNAFIMPTDKSVHLFGEGWNTVLNFTQTDGSDGIEVNSMDSQNLIVGFSNFRVAGNASGGHGFYIDTPNTYVLFDNIRATAFSATGKAGFYLKDNTTLTGMQNCMAAGGNYYGCYLENSNAVTIINPNFSSSTQTVGLYIDDDSASNIVEGGEIGNNTQNIYIGGLNNYVRSFIEGATSTSPAIEFGSKSQGNTVINTTSGGDQKVIDKGEGNVYSTPYSLNSQNKSFHLQMSSLGASTLPSITNEFYDSSFQGGGTLFAGVGSNPPVRAHDATTGYIDNNSLKLTWQTDDVDEVKSNQTFTISADDFMSVSCRVRSNRDMTDEEYLNFRIATSAETLSSSFVAGLRSGVWTPIIVRTAVITSAQAVNDAFFKFKFFHDSTPVEFILNVDEIHVEINSPVAGAVYLMNHQTAASRTLTPTGNYTPMASVDELKLLESPLSVPSATELDLPSGTLHNITGTNAITSISSADSRADRFVILKFAASVTFTDGNNLKIAGDFTATADDTITLWCDGTNWYEIARSAN